LIAEQVNDTHTFREFFRRMLSYCIICHSSWAPPLLRKVSISYHCRTGYYIQQIPVLPGDLCFQTILPLKIVPRDCFAR
jgi:hypothetical protein